MNRWRECGVYPLFCLKAQQDSVEQVGGATFDCALSLPRVMATKTLAGGEVVPTWEIAPEVAALRINPAAPTLLKGLVVVPNTAVPIPLPAGARGDALELRLNVSGAYAAGAGLSVRATNATTPGEQTLVYFLPGDKGGIGLMVASSSADKSSHSGNIVAPYPELADAGPEHVYSLRVFVDKSVIEAHVDARLSATTRAYPLRAAEATHAFVINRSPRPLTVESVEAWGMGTLWDV